MTQVELAAALGMDQSLLSRYERGALQRTAEVRAGTEKQRITKSCGEVHDLRR